MLVIASAYPYSPSATGPKRRAITAAMRNVASLALASPAKIDAPLTNRRRGKARASAIMILVNSGVLLRARRPQRRFRDAARGGSRSRARHKRRPKLPSRIRPACLVQESAARVVQAQEPERF